MNDSDQPQEGVPQDASSTTSRPGDPLVGDAMFPFLPSALKRIVRRLMPGTVDMILRGRRAVTPIAERHCNICGYRGFFQPFGRPTRLDARCPKCGSLERHRLLMLGMNRGELGAYLPKEARVLHFAPNPILERIFRDHFTDYTTADLFADADLRLNIEELDVPDEEYDVVIANHVLEHVDDAKASRELSRILKDNGVLVCQVPIIEGWESTYENPSVETDRDRWLHFGQIDHVRYYGRDFRDRIARGGFELVCEITAGGSDVAEHGLARGGKVFVFRKAS